MDGACAPWRKRLFSILEFDRTDRLSRAYTIFMMVAVLLSIIPLWFKEPPAGVMAGAWVVLGIFAFDYIARWITNDLRDRKRDGLKAFLHYPISFWAIVDLLSIISLIVPVFTSLEVLRLLVLVRLLRLVGLLRYSRNFYVLVEALDREKYALLAVAAFVVLYIIVIALVMFTCEPDMFDNAVDALYWSATTLATIGYGDLAPATALGRAITTISAVVGIGVVALPTGIITSGYVSTLNELRERFDVDNDRDSVIDRLAQRRAKELGIDTTQLTADELFGARRRASARRNGTL